MEAIFAALRFARISNSGGSSGWELRSALVEGVRAKAGQVLAWGVRSIDEGTALAGLGVDALIVDDPARFRRLP